MAIADEYVVRCLLQDTESTRSQLQWQRDGSGGYVARVNGVFLKLDYSGARIFLILRRDGQQTMIWEPRNNGVFRRSYGSEDDRRLSDSIRRLQAAAARQYAIRMDGADEGTIPDRQSIYRQLLFSETPEHAHPSSSVLAGRGVAV